MEPKKPGNSDNVVTGLVLLFTVADPQNLDKIASLRKETEPLSEDQTRKRLRALEEVELRLLGDKFLKADRISRLPIGRIKISPLQHMELKPASADIYLVVHRTGVAILEAWMDLPEQPFNPNLWIEWLRQDSTDGLVKLIQNRLPFLLDDSYYFGFVNIYTSNQSIDAFLASNGVEIIRLIYLDVSPLDFKDDFVQDELDRNFCIRKGGASFMSNLLAVNIMALEDGDHENMFISADMQAKCALPFFVTLELLLLERQVLGNYYNILATNTLSSVRELIGLKERILDGLEEYYGVITRANKFSAPLIEYGETTLGINDIYDSVIDRVDAITFDITTRSQRDNNIITFWLTVIFGALETGFLASTIAALYYVNDLFMVILWAVLPSAVMAGMLSLILYKRVR